MVRITKFFDNRAFVFAFKKIYVQNSKVGDYETDGVENMNFKHKVLILSVILLQVAIVTCENPFEAAYVEYKNQLNALYDVYNCEIAELGYKKEDLLYVEPTLLKINPPIMFIKTKSGATLQVWAKRSLENLDELMRLEQSKVFSKKLIFIEGTVEFNNIEGGHWFIKSKDGTLYLPFNFEKFAQYKHDGASAKFTLYETNCWTCVMRGQPVYILNVE